MFSHDVLCISKKVKMRKFVLSALLSLFVVGIASAFAAEIQKTDSVTTKSAPDIQKAVPEKPASSSKHRRWFHTKLTVSIRT